MEDTVDLLSLAYEVERQQGEVRRETDDFYRNVAAIFVTICSVAAKLNSDSEKTFSLIVEDLLRATESRNKTIDHLRDLTLRSTTSKGRDLEKIAKQTFSLVPGFELLERKRTATGEIDLIIRNVNEHPLFRSLGTHILVECKSSEEPVSKKEIVDFIDKVKSHRCRSGILVTPSRVSGKSGRDASGKIKEAFDRNGTILMTFTLEDLERIHLGGTATQIFYEKHEGVKFM
jgi:Holliday junction resolvase-like predicted endonuclease